MRTAHEAKLRLCIRILPNNGIIVLHALEFRVVDHIDLRVFGNQRLALLLCLGGEVCDVVQTHRAVGRSRRAEVLEIGAGCIIQFCAKPLVKAYDIRYVFHDLHADGRTKQLRFGLFGRLDFDDPRCPASFVGQQTEIRHKADDGAHDVHNAGIAVAARAEHGVGVHDGGGFRPREHLALFGLVANLGHIAGAGECVLTEQPEFFQLALIESLLVVHKFLEHKLLQRVCRDIGVERAGVC